MLKDFLWWVAGKKVGRAMFVCMSVCPSVFDSGAQTAGPIETGEYSFDALERRKDDGAGFGPIGCTWHVPLATLQEVAKNLVKTAGQTNGGFGSNLVGQ